jgi:ubiquitin-protein ligase
VKWVLLSLGLSTPKLTGVQLAKEYQAILTSPPPYITAHPSEDNILLWYYLIEGPPDTPYAGKNIVYNSLTLRWTIHG